MDAKEYLEVSLGGNMNISTLTPSAWHDIMTGFAKHYHRELAESDLGAVSGTLPEPTKQQIDLAYLTGVFNVVGIDGLHKELERLKEIGKKPHDIFAKGNYR